MIVVVVVVYLLTVEPFLRELLVDEFGRGSREAVIHSPTRDSEGSCVDRSCGCDVPGGASV